jgi:predicted RNA-binding Zn ribbon-like protein
MIDLTADQQLLLDVLNSTPVRDGVGVDLLQGDVAFLARAGGTGSEAERRQVAAVRADLQAVVRGTRPRSVLAPALRGAHLDPVLDEHITWTLSAPPDRALAARLVVAWDELEQEAPGRLRPCANDECRLFLFDRSKTNNGRWCSMAICGNRMKARRHYQKSRPAN